MENNTVMVTSTSNSTVVLNVPELMLHRTWSRRGATYPFDRRTLMQAYYTPSVEALFRSGILMTRDEEFLKEVGLMRDDGKKKIVELTEQYMHRLIKMMPLAEVRRELPQLTRAQLSELAEYAVTHYTELQMDRIDVIGQYAGKNLLKAINHYKLSQEG